MILTLTPNPALDLTYEVAAASVHTEHRVERVRSAAGGKGVNVARVLAQLGHPVTCAGPLGGATGAEIRVLLEAADGVRQAWTSISGPSRRTLTVVDAGGATGFNEPGPELSAADAAALQADLTAQLTGAGSRIEAVTLNGSLPPGLGPEHLAQWVRICREQDVPVLVDTSGPALRVAARAGAEVLKPNAAEAIAATGAATPLEAALALLEEGAGAVVCSLGAGGMLGIQRPSRPGQRPRAWRARVDRSLPGNPTGAGDSVVAVLASRLLVDGEALSEVLRHAVAVSASAVTCPVAGQIDAGLAAELAPTVLIEEIPCR